MRFAVCAALLLLGAVGVFSQNEITQRGSIPEELLRPRRGEAPRYPMDTVIGELGQGQASPEAYETAQKTAAALLAGNMNATILSSVNRVFLEGCMSMLETVNPRSFRLGGGREEPDGSVSFLVRFVGREQGITGELYVRLEELHSPPRPADTATSDPQPAASDASPDSEPVSEDEANPASENEPISAEPVAEPEQAPPISAAAHKVWLFEDLILEEPRSREAENSEIRHRFDFPPYERFF